MNDIYWKKQSLKKVPSGTVYGRFWTIWYTSNGISNYVYQVGNSYYWYWVSVGCRQSLSMVSVSQRRSSKMHICSGLSTSRHVISNHCNLYVWICQGQLVLRRILLLLLIICAPICLQRCRVASISFTLIHAIPTCLSIPPRRLVCSSLLHLPHCYFASRHTHRRPSSASCRTAPSSRRDHALTETDASVCDAGIMSRPVFIKCKVLSFIYFPLSTH